MGGVAVNNRNVYEVRQEESGFLGEGGTQYVVAASLFNAIAIAESNGIKVKSIEILGPAVEVELGDAK